MSIRSAYYRKHRLPLSAQEVAPRLLGRSPETPHAGGSCRPACLRPADLRGLRKPGSGAVDWAPHTATSFAEHMRVDRGRAHVLVPQEFLDGSDVVVRLQQVGGK